MASKAKSGGGGPLTKPGHNGRHPEQGKASTRPPRSIVVKV